MTVVIPGVSDEINAERGYCRIESQAQLFAHPHHLAQVQQCTPGLLIPIYHVGDPVIYDCVFKPDRPRSPNGKEIKYEWPARVPLVFDVLPRFRAALQDPTVELWFTEGAKKADALASADPTIVPVNLNGVDGWQSNGHPLPDIDQIPLKGRQVVIAYDSDVVRKVEVHRAIRAFDRQLRKRGATVRVLMLPETNGVKVGIDDALAQGMTMAEIRSHLGPIAALPKPHRPDAEDAAVQLAADHGDGLAYDVDLDSFRAYRDHAWQPIDDHDLTLKGWIVDAETACDLQRTINMKANVLDHAQRHLVRRFTAQAGRLAFTNGTLDVATGTLRPHDPADNLTFCLPYAWQPEQPTPTIDAALTQTIPDPLARGAFMVHCGLALLGDTAFQKAILLLGLPRTGKTTILKLFTTLVGMPSEQFASGDIFSAEREGSLQRAECRSWRGVALDEFPSDVLKDEEPFKKMVAHSGIDSRQHHKAPVTAQWLPKIVLCANDASRFRDASGAIERRLLVVTCPNVVTPAAVDLHIDARLAQELPGFAAQCMHAAQVAREVGGYPMSQTMAATFDDVATEGDPLKAFVAERCVLTAHTGKDVAIMPSDLYPVYTEWCETNGNKPLSNNSLSRQLRAYGPWHITKRHREQGTHLVGIALADSSTPYTDRNFTNGQPLSAHQERINSAWTDRMTVLTVFSNTLSIHIESTPGDTSDPIIEKLEKHENGPKTVILSGISQPPTADAQATLLSTALDAPLPADLSEIDAVLADQVKACIRGEAWDQASGMVDRIKHKPTYKALKTQLQQAQAMQRGVV